MHQDERGDDLSSLQNGISAIHQTCVMPANGKKMPTLQKSRSFRSYFRSYRSYSWPVQLKMFYGSVPFSDPRPVGKV